MQVRFVRNDFRTLIAAAGMGKAVQMLRRLPLFILNIFRDDDHRYAVLRLGDAHAAIQQMTHLRRGRGFLNEVGDVREDAIQVHLLLIAGTARGRFCLSGNRQHRGMVHFGVIESGQQVGCTRSAS